jgi:hypothetical protein
MPLTRRALIQSSAAAAIAALGKSAWAEEQPRIGREVGITTSSLSGHLAAQPAEGKFTLLQLPRFLRDELDMRVIDLNTSALASYEPEYLDRVRKAAEDAGCVITNLKLNQRGLDMSSPDAAVRRQALDEYRRSIDAAARLGARWARPLPLPQRPEMRLHVESYRELADYAAGRGVQMLVENYGWMQADPDSVVKLIESVGRNIAACPDTGNWDSEELRYAGLAKTFPAAVTCDFKARQLGPDGQHAAYDLKRCFTIGWQAGFRGPWCLEHANPDRQTLFKELALLRDLLRGWMSAA